MMLFGTIRSLILLATLSLSMAQVYAGQDARSKTHDRNWVKSQLKRRYGTTAVPDKANPKSATPPPAEKPQKNGKKAPASSNS
jgi:hypothetical protein